MDDEGKATALPRLRWPTPGEGRNNVAISELLSRSVMTFIFIVHFAATLSMVGLIWFVQIVHYPLFAYVGAEKFIAYEAAHARLTTWVVAPPMLTEAFTALILVWKQPEGVGVAAMWCGAVLLAVIWWSTVFLQVPQHTILASGFNTLAHETLVRSNWLRTAAWSARGVLVLWILTNMLHRSGLDTCTTVR
jgi:hypothetical protein